MSHIHSQNYNPKKSYPNGCMFCQEKQEKYLFQKTCPNFFKEKINTISNNQFIILELIFSMDDYFLPRELRENIFKYMVFVEKQLMTIKLNEEGIKHMMKCIKCAPSFIEFVHNNSCPHHILPRIVN